MPVNLKVNTKMVKRLPILTLEGEIDVYTYPVLNESLLELIKDGQNSIILDMEKVSYIDSTGLGVLANSANKLLQKNGELRVICSQPQLIKVFSVSGLTNNNLKIFRSAETALYNGTVKKKPVKKSTKFIKKGKSKKCQKKKK
jgi:anti-sigma B factor antagonist